MINKFLPIKLFLPHTQEDYNLINNNTIILYTLLNYKFEGIFHENTHQAYCITRKHLEGIPHQSNFQTGRKKIFMMISSHLEDLWVKLLIEVLQKASL